MDTVASRFRIGPPATSGTRLVTDRSRSERYWVYRPLTLRQQLSGHEAGRWYFRPLGNDGPSPVSLPYPSAEAAIEGIAAAQAFKDLPCEQAKATPRPR